MEHNNARRLNPKYSTIICDAGHRMAVSPEDVQPGTVVRIFRLNTGIPSPAGGSIHGDKDRHLPCAFAALRLEQMPDIILFRDCIPHSFSYCLIVVLDRTVPDFYIATLRCGTSNIRVAERCATGDGCPHLTTEHGHSMSQQVIQSTGIKTVICPAPALLSGLNKCRTLSCSGIVLSFLFTYSHFLVSPDFSL